ncbi:MAG TPA: hypothetical protein VJ840_04550 [Gemmatimonadaceae bacterium]|nr:hypothetical protein [Gemmatimonadaceae bacterium]
MQATAKVHPYVLQIPTTPEEMRALLTQRREISDQLGSATDRRNDIMEKLRTAPDDARPGLRAQLQVLDARVVQLEKDLGTVGQEISAASPQVLRASYDRPAPSPNPHVRFQQGMVAAGVPIFLIMSAVLLFSRWRWRRESRKRAPALPSADSERLQRVENGMEAMSIEIERISEGQRFVTKLLAESRSIEPTPR